MSAPFDNPTAFLQDLFVKAVEAADPAHCLARHLPAPPKKGRVLVIGAGKASAAMAQALETAWPEVNLQGLVVARYGYAVACRKIEIVEAAHPVPDAAGEDVARRMLRLVSGLTSEDLVVALISGGGSSLLPYPASCLTLQEKRDINKALLRSGAPIQEMNCVRKHLSAVKGGRLALACHPAKILTLLISDIPGDEASAIASGPTLPDPTTLGQALAVIDRYQIPVSQTIRDYLKNPANETPKADDPAFSNNQVHIIAKAADALSAAQKRAMAYDLKTRLLGDDIEGEARQVGKDHAGLILSQQGSGLILSGGETTVTVRGNGRGGRNVEYLLSALMESKGKRGIYGLACDTDGIDGSEDNAGAYFTPDCFEKARRLGLNAQACLDNNDAYSFFEKLGTLVKTGPTRTNVNDFRALLAL